MDQRAIVGPPRHAVAAGAATPIGLAGAVIWSTTENRLLMWNGTTWQPAKDYLGSVVYNQSTTLQLSDANAFLGFDVTGLHTITVPPNVFPVGQVINGVQLGPGISQFVAGADVTIRALGNILTAYTKGVYSTWTLYQRSQNVWELSGDITSSGPTQLFALTGFSAFNFFYTLATGGEPGVATGFGVFPMFRVNALGTTGRTIIARSNNSNAGWMVYVGTTNLLRFYVANGAGTLVSGATYQLTASDVGKVLCFLGLDTGSAVQTWVSRTLIGPDVARTGYTVWSGQTTIGAADRYAAPDAATSIDVLGALTFQGVPSPAVIQSLFDVARQTGDVPTALLNAPVRGLQSFTPAGNFYTTSGGFAGARAGFAVGIHLRWDVVPSGANGRLMGKCDNASKGWRIIGYTGGLYYLQCYSDAGASFDSPYYTVQSSDVGVPMFALFVHDGSYLRTYIAGSEKGYREIGNGTAITGYTDPGATAFFLGRDGSGVVDASAATFFGTSLTKWVPTNAEMAAWFDACKAAGRIQPLPEESHRYDVTADTTSVSPTAPATLVDHAGAAPLSKTGTPTVVSAGATITHRVSSRDALKTATNLLGRKTYGARNFSIAAYYSAAAGAGIRGSANGFFVALDFTPTVIGTGGYRLPVALETPWDIRIGGSGALNFTVNLGGGASGTYQLLASDLGRRMLVIGNYRGGTSNNLELWVYRTLQGAPGSYNFGSISVTGSEVMTVGKRSDGFADTVDTIWGVQGGTITGGLTVAEILALYDSWESTGQLSVVARATGQHLYTLDSTAASGLPTTWLDRIGSDNLTKQSPPAPQDSGTSVGPFSAGFYYTSASSSTGIVGATTGFWVAVEYTQTVLSGTQMIVGQTYVNTNGWYIRNDGSGPQAYFNPGGYVTPLPSGGAPAGTKHRFVFVFDGVAGTLKAWLNGTLAGTVTGVSFTAATSTLQIGYLVGSGWVYNGRVHVLEGGSFVPSDTEVAQLFTDSAAAGTLASISGKTSRRYVVAQDVAAVGGALPASLVDRMGSAADALLRVGGYLELAIDVASTLPVPASIADSTSSQAVDSLGRAGEALGLSFDLAREGRKTYGLTGFATGAFLATAANKGIRGSTSFWAGVKVTPYSGSVIEEWLCCWAQGNYGWEIWWDNYKLKARAANAAGTFVDATYLTLTANDMGQNFFVFVVLSDGVLRLFYARESDGVLYESGTGVLIAGYTAPGNTVPMRIGMGSMTPWYAASTSKIWGALGGNGATTRAALQGIVSQWISTGVMPLVGDHAYDFTADIAAAGETVPSVCVDRIGSDDLTRYGGLRAATALTPVYGIQGLSTANYYSLATGGPTGTVIDGVAVIVHFRVDRAPTATGMLVDRYPTSGTGGFALVLDSSGYCYLAIRDNTNAQVNSSMYQFVAADYGVPVIVVAQFKLPNIVQFWICKNGVITQLADTTATNAFLPPSSSLALGVGVRVADGAANYAATGVSIFDVEVSGSLTSTQVTSAIETTQMTGKIPLAGNASWIWKPDFQAAISATSGGIPATISDTNGTGHLVRTGLPQLALSGKGQGIADWTVSHAFQTRTGLGLVGSTTAGFWVSVLIRVPSAAATGTLRQFWSTYTGSNGAFLRVDGNNAIACSVTLATYPLASAYGTFLVVTLVHTGTGATGRMYVNGIRQGTGGNLDYPIAYVASTGSMTLGFNAAGPNAEAGDIEIFGVVGGNGYIPTDAEMWTHYLACAENRAPVAIPSKTTHLYDITKDLVAAGSSLPTYLRERIAGVEHMARVGAPLQPAPRIERVYGNEVSPIMYGLSNFSDADYYDTQDGENGDVMGWWGYVVFVVTSQNVTSATRALLGKTTSASGWDVRVTGTNSVLQLGIFDAAGTPTYGFVGTTALAATDVGKISMFGWAWDAPAGATGSVRTYWKRALTSTTVRNGYTVSASRLLLGGVSSSTGNTANAGLSILGFVLGRGTPALGEWQYAYDAVMAKEAVVAIPGRTTMLVDITSDIRENSGALPGMLKDRVGTSHLAKTGQPAVTPHYARAFGW